MRGIIASKVICEASMASRVMFVLALNFAFENMSPIDLGLELFSNLNRAKVAGSAALCVVLLLRMDT